MPLIHTAGPTCVRIRHSTGGRAKPNTVSVRAHSGRCACLQSIPNIGPHHSGSSGREAGPPSESESVAHCVGLRLLPARFLLRHSPDEKEGGRAGGRREGGRRGGRRRKGRRAKRGKEGRREGGREGKEKRDGEVGRVGHCECSCVNHKECVEDLREGRRLRLENLCSPLHPSYRC